MQLWCSAWFEMGKKVPDFSALIKMSISSSEQRKYFPANDLYSKGIFFSLYLTYFPLSNGVRFVFDREIPWINNINSNIRILLMRFFVRNLTSKLNYQFHVETKNSANKLVLEALFPLDFFPMAHQPIKKAWCVCMCLWLFELCTLESIRNGLHKFFASNNRCFSPESFFFFFFFFHLWNFGMFYEQKQSSGKRQGAQIQVHQMCELTEIMRRAQRAVRVQFKFWWVNEVKFNMNSSENSPQDLIK